MLGSISGVLMEGLDGDRTWHLKDYVARGGYAQLKRILENKISQEEVIGEVKICSSWSWWSRLPNWFKVVVYAPVVSG